MADIPTEYVGPCGRANNVLQQLIDREPDKPHGAVGFWFVHAPRQTPLWHHYVLACVHLRPMGDLPDPNITEAGATHEFHLFALDPDPEPSVEDPSTWSRLLPANFIGQYVIAGDPKHADQVAAEVCALAAEAITDGRLWAEPPLSGQTEPWHTALQTTISHYRDGHPVGEGHGRG